jgi:hypothetical protein
VKFEAHELIFYTIYDHPRDFPDHYVLRPHYVGRHGIRAGPVACLSESLAALREPLEAAGLLRFVEGPSGDPAILETWL